MKFPRTLILESNRCQLRASSRADIPHVFSASQYPGFTDGMLWEPPEKEEELIEPYENGVKAWQEGTAYSFTIELKHSLEFIGRISIRREDEESVWNLGFWTHPRHQGQGYMSESVARIIEFGFVELEAKQIVACHAIWNVASERVLKKAGMRMIRYIPEGFKKNGEWVEENLLGVSSDSWRQHKGLND